MTQSEKTFIKNRHGLPITVYTDKPDKNVGTLFFMHSFLSEKKRNTHETLIDISVANGLTVVSLDAAYSAGPNSISPEKANVTTYKEDLQTVVEWAQGQDFFETPYILAGSSLGSLAILEHAHEHPESVKAIAPIAAVVSGNFSAEAQDRQEHGYTKRWQENGEAIYPFVHVPEGEISIPWDHMQDRLKYDALAYAHQLTMPAFMFVGDNDTLCPPDHQRALFDTLGSNYKEWHFIKGMPHSWSAPEHLAQFKTHFDHWLKKVI